LLKLIDNIPDIAKYIPAKTFDDIVKSIHNGKKFSKNEYLKLNEIYTAAGKNFDEMISGTTKIIDKSNFKPQYLLDELASSGKKYNAEDLIFVSKMPDGTLAWLEKGNHEAGLMHIIEGHETDLYNRGVTDVEGFLYRLTQSKPINSGINDRGPFSDYIIDNKMYKLAYGTNGFIVTLHPM
jgi:hypothetical protein